MTDTPRTSLSKVNSQRSGKYRHLYGEAAKTEACFTEIKNPLSSGESTFVKANSKYFAVPKTGGGGPVYIRRLDRPGRFPPNAHTLSVHKGTTLDFDFHPFIENMIATGSEDTHVCITKFPKEGLKATIQEPDVSLSGHGKKVTLVEFNPSASSILATGAFDHSIRVWNIETAKNVCTYDALDDNVYSMSWNYDGSLLAATAKDKKLQLFDPRKPKAAQVVESFDGAKSSKLFWVPCLNWIGATGHTKTSKRQIKLWDLNNLSNPLETFTIDSASSILQPMYDNDIGVLYLVGKGDGTITYYELVNDDKKIYMLANYRSTEPQKGGGWAGKKALNVWKCEVARFLKLTSKSIIPISFIVPRKSGEEVFQADIYPDTFAGKPALTAEEWTKGNNKPPVLMSLDPSTRQDLNDVANENDINDNNENNDNNADNENNDTNTNNKSNDNIENKNNDDNDNKNEDDDNNNEASEKRRPYEEVIEENARLKERVRELEIKLGMHTSSNENSKVDSNNDNNASSENTTNNPTNNTENTETMD